jgi:hypothetical protein
LSDRSPSFTGQGEGPTTNRSPKSAREFLERSRESRVSRAHTEAKTEELEMPWPGKETPVTTEKELEPEGEQAIPVHRHGFVAVVFHPGTRSPRERSLRMDSCVVFRGRGGAAAAAAMEAWRHKKESSGSGSEKPWLELEPYLLLLILSPMAGRRPWASS